METDGKNLVHRFWSNDKMDTFNKPFFLAQSGFWVFMIGIILLLFFGYIAIRNCIVNGFCNALA